MNYLLDISYRGTAYSGWQVQKNGLAVQQVIDDALSTLLKQPIFTLGSGRTDAGVHARQQIAQFRCEMEIEPSVLLHRINAFLPHDISVNGIYEGPEKSNVRFDALSRSYRYFILSEKSPFEQGMVWLKRGYKPDLELLNALSSPLIGKHDFMTFSKTRKGDKHFDCEVFEAKWRFEAEKLVFEIRANRFLRGMVRAIVSTLVKLEQQKAGPEELERLLRSKNRSFAATLAPPEGLFLWQVSYPEGYIRPLPLGGK
jgi:tRNA pseudouridine38-40 synthase